MSRPHQASYGIELIVNASGCDVSVMSRSKLARFIEELCKKIDMKRALKPYFWDEINGGVSDEPHLQGISVFQFIETSNIAIHALTKLEVIFFNIFSCKPFERQIVEDYIRRYFKAERLDSQLIERTYVARVREEA